VPNVAEPVLAGDLGAGAAVGVGQRERQLANGARGAAAHVVGAQRARLDRGIASCERLNRGDGGAGNVADVHEVPSLGPVLEDTRRAAGRKRGTEERRHPGVRRVAGHPRAVHVVIAQRHRLPRGHPGPRSGQVLLRDLGVGVDVARPERRLFQHQFRQQRLAAVLTARLEPARV
jgi:hypothetical protein